MRAIEECATVGEHHLFHPMDQHLTVSEAREFNGKSESTIKRLLREIVGDPQHVDRLFILPSAEEVERRKAAKEPMLGRLTDSCC